MLEKKLSVRLPLELHAKLKATAALRSLTLECLILEYLRGGMDRETRAWYVGRSETV